MDNRALMRATVVFVTGIIFRLIIEACGGGGHQRVA